MIERQADGMSRLVDEMLASAQSRALQPTLRRAATTAQLIVARSVEIVEPLASSHRQALTIRNAAQPIHLAADEFWLVQALQNVLDNAIKYTDPGGQIEVEVTREGTDVAISVRDTGIGLEPSHLESVFDLYMQVSQPATRPRTGGLGVGLHLAKFVVDAHGGSIRALSEGLGRGSTFIIRLPCSVTASSPSRLDGILHGFEIPTVDTRALAARGEPCGDLAMRDGAQRDTHAI
jgi:signal transduction histidine kinase